MKRFWIKIREQQTGCHEWTAGKDEYGYGRFLFNGRNTHAHRVAWTLLNGAIPNGAKILHRCDNPACCNVDHLFIGTDADNVADRDAKGRRASTAGIKNGRHKLSPDIVSDIRRSTEPNNKLANIYSVSDVVISQIRSRKLWSSVP